jgi:hypothetical protein
MCTAEEIRMIIKEAFLRTAPPKEWDLWINYLSEMCAPHEERFTTIPTNFRENWLVQLLSKYHTLINWEIGKDEELKEIPIDDIIDCLTFYGIWE